MPLLRCKYCINRFSFDYGCRGTCFSHDWFWRNGKGVLASCCACSLTVLRGAQHSSHPIKEKGSREKQINAYITNVFIALRSPQALLGFDIFFFVFINRPAQRGSLMVIIHSGQAMTRLTTTASWECRGWLPRSILLLWASLHPRQHRSGISRNASNSPRPPAPRTHGGGPSRN